MGCISCSIPMRRYPDRYPILNQVPLDRNDSAKKTFPRVFRCAIIGLKEKAIERGVNFCDLFEHITDEYGLEEHN